MVIIDRFEEAWAVLEYEGTTFNFPRALLPREAREGDVLKLAAEVDVGTTDDRRRRVKELEGKLFKE